MAPSNTNGNGKTNINIKPIAAVVGLLLSVLGVWALLSTGLKADIDTAITLKTVPMKNDIERVAEDADDCKEATKANTEAVRQLGEVVREHVWWDSTTTVNTREDIEEIKRTQAATLEAINELTKVVKNGNP